MKSISNNIEIPKSDKTYNISMFIGIVFSLLTTILCEIFFNSIDLGPKNIDFISRVTVVFLTIFSIYGFYVRSSIKKDLKIKNFITIFMVLFLSIIVLKFFQFLTDALINEIQSSDYGFKLTSTELTLAFPMATGALLIQSVMNTRMAAMFVFIWSAIIGFYFVDTIFLFLFTISSSLVAVSSVVKVRSRGVYLRAGLNIALLSIPFSLIILLSSESFVYIDFLICIFSRLLGGLFCYLIASGLTPILEHLGNYVTDMRLIEIATLDHPLLNELSIQASGTWNHSMVMGMMGEMASDLVGANPVLVRTGAYFHDIGKIKKTMYFIENQQGEDNPHDKLTPSMSALIIKSHVKEGVEMAQKYKLPSLVIDMIKEHHGTSLIEYFYNKALNDQKDNAEEVDELLYRYPGPKPQSKEAGILMLADCIEASVRALPEHTKDNIQVLVKKMINKIFAAGQLDECDLTLNDLYKIAGSFVKTLTGIYHQRIAYVDNKEANVNTILK